MKKLVSTFIVLGLTMAAADAAPSYVARNGQSARSTYGSYGNQSYLDPDAKGGYRVTYDYTDKEKSGWYFALRAELSLLNWKNTYDSAWVGQKGEDKYSFEPIFGGSVSVGKRFGYFWRGEIEAGYNGRFTDSDAGIDFKFQTPYVLANALYDFNSGLYVGGGLGVAIPMTTWDGDIFLEGDRNKTSVSPMAGLMFGYSYKIDDNFILDLRYRLAGFMGSKHTRSFEATTDGGLTYQVYDLETKIDLVLENSFSVGLRYEF